MENQNAYLIGVLIGGLIAGVFCGTAPLISGIVKKRLTLGIIGFVSCIFGGLILGVLLALPLALIFTMIIVLRKTEDENFTAPPNPPTFNQ